MLRKVAVAVLLIAVAVTSALAQGRKKDDDDKTRMVQGTVTDSKDNAVDGAVVQLKNTKTLQVRSYITKEHGTYYFHGLDPNIDYMLKAENQGKSSQSKTLSAFDSRKQPVINLKLEN
ncbi:MAG: carboxypeptidase-like regulatory domain-containing protein [Bryobacteraceae bacterium]